MHFSTSPLRIPPALRGPVWETGYEGFPPLDKKKRLMSRQSAPAPGLCCQSTSHLTPHEGLLTFSSNASNEGGPWTSGTEKKNLAGWSWQEVEPLVELQKNIKICEKRGFGSLGKPLVGGKWYSDFHWSCSWKEMQLKNNVQIPFSKLVNTGGNDSEMH